MTASTRYQLFVGIDIAATSFAASWTSDANSYPPGVKFEQTPSGFTALQQRISATGVAPAQTLIVLEATGSYWVTFAVTMHLFLLFYMLTILGERDRRKRDHPTVLSDHHHRIRGCDL